MPEPVETLAAIDVGTNSFHLVVARVTGEDRFEVVTSEKEMVRLGTGSGDMKRLTPEAIQRGVDTLRRMKQIADIDGAPVRAVATERGPGGREPRRVRDAGAGGGRRRGRGHLRGRGGPPHPPRRAAGRAGLRPAPAAVRHRRRLDRGAGRRAGPGPDGPQLQARRGPPDQPLLPRRAPPPERGVVVPHVRPLDPLAVRQGGRGPRVRGGGRLVGDHPGGRRDRAGGDGRRADPARSTASASRATTSGP